MPQAPHQARGPGSPLGESCYVEKEVHGPERGRGCLPGSLPGVKGKHKQNPSNPLSSRLSDGPEQGASHATALSISVRTLGKHTCERTMEAWVPERGPARGGARRSLPSKVLLFLGEHCPQRPPPRTSWSSCITWKTSTLAWKGGAKMHERSEYPLQTGGDSRPRLLLQAPRRASTGGKTGAWPSADAGPRGAPGSLGQRTGHLSLGRDPGREELQ